MREVHAVQEPLKRKDDTALWMLKRCCGDLPYSILERIVLLYEQYGLSIALEAARAVISLQELHQ